MGKYFYLEESPTYANKYLIKMKHENFLFPTGTTGSYNVFIARVMNLSYAQYLRFARDQLGAELVGKNRLYVLPYFTRNKETDMFIKVLNSRMEYIMNEHNNPYDYKEVNGIVERIPFGGQNDTENESRGT